MGVGTAPSSMAKSVPSSSSSLGSASCHELLSRFVLVLVLVLVLALLAFALAESNASRSKWYSSAGIISAGRRSARCCVGLAFALDPTLEFLEPSSDRLVFPVEAVPLKGESYESLTLLFL